MTARFSPRVRRLVVWLVVPAFVAGAFAGVAADRILTPHVRLRTPVGETASVVERLGLSGEERRQAEAILSRRAPRAHAIILDAAGRLKAVSDSVDAELRAILTPEQRARLDSLKPGGRVMLKRRIQTPQGMRVDTLLDTAMTR